MASGQSNELGLHKHHSVAVGPSRGFPAGKRSLPERPSRRKGRLGKRTKMVKEVVKEVAGQAPYERRLLELLRVGREKRALKVAKKKLGGHHRGKKKRDEMAQLIRKQRAQAQAQQQ